MRPHAGLIYDETVPDVVLEEFVADTAAQREALAISSRPTSGPFAGIEWLLPTAIAVWVGKSYFEAFLKEAGKDHYQALKNASAKLAAKLSPVKATLIGTPGKASAEPAYSLIFSIMSETEDGARIKLLVPTGLNEDEAHRVAGALMDFLEAHHTGSLNRATRAMMAEAPRLGHTVLISYDLSNETIVFVDVRTRTASPAPANDPD